MISINRNDPPSYGEPDNQSLQNLVNKLQDEIDLLDTLSLNNDPNQSIIKECNIKDLLDIVYQKLYDENHATLNIIVGKNKNNSLGIILDVIE
jgi:hypothetical protein